MKKISEVTFYKPQYVQECLEQFSRFREYLYCRGFLIAENGNYDTDDYPFYGNWKITQLNKKYYAYTVYFGN